MYFILVVMFIFLFVGLINGFSSMPVKIAAFIDFPTLLTLLLFSLPIIAASGLWKDLVRSFKVVDKRFKFTRLEIERSHEAVDLLTKLLINSAIIEVATSFIIVIRGLDDPAALGPNISVILLSLFYMAISNFIMLNVKSMLKVKIINGDYIEDVVLIEEINDESNKNLNE